MTNYFNKLISTGVIIAGIIASNAWAEVEAAKDLLFTKVDNQLKVEMVNIDVNNIADIKWNGISSFDQLQEQVLAADNSSSVYLPLDSSLNKYHFNEVDLAYIQKVANKNPADINISEFIKYVPIITVEFVDNTRLSVPFVIDDANSNTRGFNSIPGLFLIEIVGGVIQAKSINWDWFN